MSRLETTRNDQLTINDEILPIFAVPDYESTNQMHTEYLNDNAKPAYAVDVPSSLLPITDHLDEPLSL